MSSPMFAKTHNLVAFLEKPTESDGFEQIVDFLNVNPIKYALTVSPTIYTSCIKQFWTAAKVKTVNDDVRLQALVDGKKVIVNEASIKRDLRLDDAKSFSGVTTPLFETMMVQAPEEVGDIPTDTQDIPILTQPSSSQPQRKHKPRKKQREATEVPRTGSQAEERVPTPSHDPLPRFFLWSKPRPIKLEGKKKRTHGLKRLYKGRIAEIDANEYLFLIDETTQDHGRIKDQDLFRVHDLDGDEAKDKGKGIMVEPEKPLKKKDQIAEVARKLEAKIKAEIDEEERIAREKNEANRVIKEWDDVQATIDANRQLAKQIQAQEREQLSIEERSKLLAELIVSRRKECGGKPKENLSRKIEATPISSKSPTIVDYKIYKEGKKRYFKIIRADGNSQNYLTFGTMFKNFNIEDLEVLRSIVKERFKKTNPVDDMDNLLFQTLKTMFEHHVEDIIWKYQQGVVKVNNWKLFDSCGVYCVTTKNVVDYEVEMAYDLLRLIRRQINEGYKPE
nr:hypothetical protein [Tanacetum cinerariifolium]